MEIEEYWRALRRRAWIPLLLMVVAVAASGVLAYLSKPQYTATASVIAKNPSGGADNTLSFSAITTSNTLAMQVVDQLQLADTVDSLVQRIKVSNDRGSNLYRITVTDSDPSRATRIADAVAQSAARLYMDLGGGTNEQISAEMDTEQATYLQRYERAMTAMLDYEQQYPAAETSKDGAVRAGLLRRQLEEKTASDAYVNLENDLTKARVDQLTNAKAFDARVVDRAAARQDVSARLTRILYAAVLSLVVGIAIVFALEYFDKSVRRPDDIEELVGAPVIGIITHGDARALRTAQRE